MEPLHVAGRARLHDGLVALVEGDAADGLDAAGQAARHDLGGTDAEVLLHPRADAHRAFVGAGVGIHRDELHVHERRLAGLVELAARHHRVVPVQHPAAVGGGVRPGRCGRRDGRRIGAALALAEPVEPVAAEAEQAGQHGGDHEAGRFHRGAPSFADASRGDAGSAGPAAGSR